MVISLTKIWIEYFLGEELEEFFGHAPFVDSLLAIELDKQLLFQIARVVHENHLQLQTDRL